MGKLAVERKPEDDLTYNCHSDKDSAEADSSLFRKQLVSQQVLMPPRNLSISGVESPTLKCSSQEQVHRAVETGTEEVGQEAVRLTVEEPAEEELEDEELVVTHKDVDRGWAWVVLVGGFCSFAVSSGLLYTFSMYFVIFIQVFQESRSYTAWIGSLLSAVFMMSGPVVSLFIMKFGCRAAVLLGGILSSVGYAITSMAPNLQTMFISHGVITAVGFCLNYSGWVIAISRYFQRRHAMAASITMAGTGLGLFLFAPVLQQILEEYSWRGALLLSSGFSLNYCLFGSVIYPLEMHVKKSKSHSATTPRNTDEIICPMQHKSVSNLYLSATASYLSSSMNSLHRLKQSSLDVTVEEEKTRTGLVTEDIGNTNCDEMTTKQTSGKHLCGVQEVQLKNIIIRLLCKIQARKTNEKKIKERNGNRKDMSKISQINSWSLIQDYRLWAINFSCFFWSMATNTMYIIYKDWASSHGLNKDFTYALSLVGLGDMCGRLCAGVIASHKKVNHIILFVCSQLFCSCLIVAHLGVHTPTQLITVGFFFGMSYGLQNVLLAVVPSSIFGNNHLSIILGYVLFFCGTGALIGGPLAGWIVDQTEDYDIPICFFTFSELIAAGAMFISYILNKQKNLKLPSNTYESQPMMSEEKSGHTLPVSSKAETHTQVSLSLTPSEKDSSESAVIAPV